MFRLLIKLHLATFALTLLTTASAAEPIPYNYGRNASFNVGDKTAVFMNSARYTNWDIPSDKKGPGFPQPLASPAYQHLFNGQGVDAAVRLVSENAVYFFKNDEYIVWDNNTYRSFSDMPTQSPRTIISRFPGVFDGKNIDAAVTFGDSRLYFFKGDQYIRWDTNTNKISTVDNYPVPISRGWPGLFDGSGIDHAVRFDDHRLYFFKDAEYIRWDIKTDRISDAGNYPAPTNAPTAFPGLFPGAITIGPRVPHDLERPGHSSNEFQVKKAQWAWQQFVALGWKAIYNPENNVFERGIADRSWRQVWTGSDDPESVVWETFAHRTELRPFGKPLTKPYDSLPEYVSYPSVDGRLLRGKNQNGGPASFLLLNNLDEDNEIGSADVYLGDVTDANRATTPLVLYQAKTNRDEYDYLKNTFGSDQYDKKGSLANAASQTAANIKAFKAYYKGSDGKPSHDTCNVPAGVDPTDTIVLPCGKIGGQEGAIEIKTAFYKIPTGQEAAFSDFLIRDAIYYTKAKNPDGSDNAIYTYHNDKFALLGMHIIHKTTNFPDFIFTSFEHRALSSMDFRYRLISPLPPLYGNFNPHGATDPKTPGGTQIGDLQKVVRQTGSNPSSTGQLYPIPAPFQIVNDAAMAQLKSFDSPWQHYQVIGVQAEITEHYSAIPTGTSGPNHYMANHVIESDAFLGNFIGPGFSSLHPAFPKGPKAADGTKNGDNILYKGNVYNTGGCKGCHGVAQTAFGLDFSFLMDFSGKPVTEIDSIFYVKPN